MMRRRDVIGLAIMAAMAAGQVWSAKPLPRIGVADLAPFVPTPENPKHGIVGSLMRFDLVEGRDYELILRSANAEYKNIPALAQEMVDLKPDIIVSGTSGLTMAMAKLTKTIPIVFTNMPDPVGMGVVSNLSHPGGNVTGTSAGMDLINAKHCDLMAAIVPGLKRIALLLDAQNDLADMVKVYKPAADRVGAQLLTFYVKTADQIGPAFVAMKKQRVQAVIVVQDRFLFTNAAEIARASLREAIPAASRSRIFADAGLLFSYGEDVAAVRKNLAGYIVKVLRGAKPGDLPVQLPIKFNLVVNQTTANRLKLKVPESILLLADEVVEKEVPAK